MTIKSARRPCWTTLSRLAATVATRSSASCARRRVEGRLRQDVLQLVQNLARQAGEIVNEIERVLDFVGDAGGELPERGELLRLDQPVLRVAQVLERGGELLGAGLHLAEQPRVLDRDDGLVGEGLHYLDLTLR